MRRRRFMQRRKLMGYTQESFAEKLRVDRTTVGRWECGDCEPQPWFRKKIAAALDLSLAELDALLTEDTAPLVLDNPPGNGTTVGTPSDDGGDPMDRRHFTITTALAGLGMTSPLRQLLVSQSPPMYLGMDQLRQVEPLIDGFEQADAVLGGDVLCDAATVMHDRLSDWERTSNYRPAVGERLSAMLGELEAWIGWLAIDEERRPQAQRYLHSAIVRARLVDDPQLEVRAMVMLSLLIRDGRPSESLQCADAAQRIARVWATPRLTTLLHLRKAHAYAALGDTPAVNRELAHAQTQLDHGLREDDPPYLNFVTPMELAGITGLSFLALGRPDRAAGAFTSIIERPHPEYRRNLGYYRVQLAETLRRQADITGASEAALSALPVVTALRSSRTGRLLASLRAGLDAHTRRVPKAGEFVSAYDEGMRA